MVDPSPAPRPDLYELLGVAPTADAAEVGRAYRRRVREVHPDTADPARASGQDDGADELGAIQDAYLVLRDPERRARYDRERADRERADRERSDRPAHPAGPRTNPAPAAVPVPVRVHVRPAPVQPPLLRAGPVRVERVRRRRGPSPG